MLLSLCCYSAILHLALADVTTKVTGKDVVLSDTGIHPVLNSSYGEKKLVSIVVSPIIHNIAQGYGGGGRPGDIITETPVEIFLPENPFAGIISLLSRPIRYLKSLMVNGFAGIFRSIIRFIICTFVPICGIFSIFGDEEVSEPLITPEGVARGLGFLESFIEKYHNIETST